MTELKPDQIEVFRERLLSSQIEIAALLTQTVGDSKPVDLDLPIGRLSRADAMQMQNMAAVNKRQLDIRLKQVEGALSAIKDGSFGLCRSCRGQIPPARLDARPETPFCIGCQEEFEQQR